MTMRSMNAHIEGHKMSLKMKDEENWILGKYVMSAVFVAVEHNLSKKAKSEYVEKPFIEQAEEQRRLESSEEEKRRKTEQFFMQLKIMQANFELEKEEG